MMMMLVMMMMMMMMMMVMVVPDDGDDDDDDMRREVTSVKTVIDLFSFTPPLFYRQASQVFQETYFTAARTFSWSLRRMKTASTMVAVCARAQGIVSGFRGRGV
jgi:hypothetical protein